MRLKHWIWALAAAALVGALLRAPRSRVGDAEPAPAAVSTSPALPGVDVLAANASRRAAGAEAIGERPLDRARLGREESLRRRGGEIGFNSTSYGATLSRSAVEVATPYGLKGLGRPRLSWSFESAKVGGLTLARAGEVEPALNLDRREIVYARGAVEEKYLLRPDGLEQVFVIPALPARGAITVSGRVESNLEAPEGAGRRIAFTHRGSEVLSISKAVAIDGAGRREPLELAYAAGRVSMTIPAGWVARATLPITIDPLIGGAVLVDGKLEDLVTSVHGLDVRAADVAHAAAANEYLVVWAEPFGASGFNFDVLGRRISATGRLLGDPILIGASGMGDDEPTVCWAAGVDRYLVAWRQDPGDNGWDGDQRIQGRVLASDGSFVTGEFTIDDAPGQDFGPSAAFDGARWYVAWTQVVDASNLNALGRFVSAAGAPENAANADVEADVAARPTAAFAGAGYVLAWEKKTAGGTAGIVARTMDAAGSFTSAITAASQTTRPAGHADVTAGSGKALIAWQEQAADGTWDVLSRIVDPALAFQGGAFAVGALFSDQVTPRGAYAPAIGEWFVAYADPVRAREDVYGNRVSGTGDVRPAERLTRSGKADLRPELAVNAAANEALVVFLQAGRNGFQLRAQLLALGEGAPPTPGAPSGQPNPNNTGSHVVSWAPSSGAGLSYELERSADGGAAFALAATTAATSFAESGLPEGSYVYRVRARSAEGTVSAYSGESPPVVVDLAAPAAPAALGQFRSDGLTAIPAGGTTTEGAVVFQGALADAATRVRLEVELKPSGTPFDGLGLIASAFVTSGETASVLATPLTEGAYHWRARAADEAGNAGAFAEFGGDPGFVVGPSEPPAAPANLTADPGNARVALSWNAAAGADSYAVKRGTASGGPYGMLAAVASTSYADLTAENGTTYYYVVTALNAAGESAPSDEASATPQAPPAAPTDLAAQPGNNQVTLSWTASAGADRYTVKRSTSPAGPFDALAEGIVATSYADRTALNGTTYHYVVSALNVGGESPDSAPASATPLAPPAPPTLGAAPGDGQVTLSWGAVAGATSYSVYRGTTSGGPYAPIASGLMDLSYVDVGLANGTEYFYVATASNAGGESGFSNEASAVPAGAPLAAPVITTASHATNDATPAVAGTSEPDVAITVFFTRDGATVEALATTSSAAGAWSVSAGPKADGTYVVFARASNGSSTSPDSNAIAITVDTVPPAVDLVTSSTADGTYGAGAAIGITVGFSEPVTLSGGSLTVTLDTGAVVAIGAFGPSTAASGVYGVAAGENSPDLTALSPLALSGGILRDAAGNDALLGIPAGRNLGDLKNIVIGTLTPPAPPSGLTATGQLGAIALQWTAPAVPVNGYRIYRSGTTPDLFAEIAADVPGTSYTDGALGANALYRYYVTAVNGSGESGPSNVAEAATLLEPPAGAALMARSWHRVGIVVTPPPNANEGQTGLAIDRSEDGGASWQAVQGFMPLYDMEDFGRAPETTILYRCAFRNRAGVPTAFAGPFAAVTQPFPPPTITSPAPHTVVTLPDLEVMGTSPEEVVTVRVLVDGVPQAPIQTQGTTWRASAVGLLDGPHFVSARFSDDFGNVSPDAPPVDVIVDANPPVIVPVSPAPGSTTSSSPMVSATWSDGQGTQVNPLTATLSFDHSGPVAGFTADDNGIAFAASDLPAGVRTVTVTVRDAIGHLATRSWSFTVGTPTDTTPPTVSLTPADASLIVDATPSLTATYADETGGSGIDPASFRAFLNEEDVTASFSAGGSFASWTPAGLPDGLYLFRAVVADTAGNATTVESFFRIVSAFGTLSASAGGTLSVTEAGKNLLGASITLPPGAIAEDARFIVSEPRLPGNFPTAFRRAGPPALFEPAAVFASSATILLPYAPAQVPEGAAPRLLRQDGLTGEWSEVAGAVFDVPNGRVSASIAGLAAPLFVVAYAIVDPALSGITASPSSLPADGITTSVITVTPRDAAGQAVGAGQDVRLSIESGEALLGPVIDLGDGSYRGFVSSTVPSPAGVVIRANVGSLDLTASTTVVFTPVEAVPATIELSGLTNPAEAGAPAGLTVTLRDSNGFVMKLFAGRLRLTLTGTSDAFGAPVFPAQLERDFGPFEQGVLALSGELSFASAGVQSVTAELPGLSTPPAAASLTVTPSAFARLLKSVGDEQSVLPGQTLPLRLTARAIDRFGNGIGGVSVHFQAIEGGGGFAGPTDVVSGPDGSAQAPDFTVGGALGVNRVEASAAGVEPEIFTAYATRPAPAVSSPSGNVDGPSFTVSGNAGEAGLTIEVYAGGALVGTGVSGPGGAFEVKVLVPPGSAQLTVVSVDGNGLVSLVSAPLAVVVFDVQGPVFTVKANEATLVPGVPGFVSSRTPDIRVSYADPSGADTGSLSVLLDGLDLEPYLLSQDAGSALYRIPSEAALAAGPRLLSVSMADVPGFVASASYTMTVDLLEPGLRLAPSNGSVVLRNDPQLRVFYRDPGDGTPDAAGVDPSTLRITLNGSDVTSQFSVGASEALRTYTPADPLPTGHYLFEAVIQDRAGNLGRHATSFTVNPDAFDGEPPVVDFQYPSGFIGKPPGMTVNVAVDARDNFGIERVELREVFFGQPDVLLATSFAEPYLFSVQAPAIEGQSRQIKAVAVDVRGNIAETFPISVSAFNPFGTSAQRFDVILNMPEPLVAGAEVSATIRAMTGTVKDGSFTGFVSVSGTDPDFTREWDVSLTFTAADAGEKTVLLPPFLTAGYHTISASRGGELNGARTGIRVIPGPATRISLEPPPGVFQTYRAGWDFELWARAFDAYDNLVPGVQFRVTSVEEDVSGALSTRVFTPISGSPAVVNVSTSATSKSVSVSTTAPEIPGAAGSAPFSTSLSGPIRVNIAFETGIVERGKPVSFTVFILDLNGVLITDFEGTVYIYALDVDGADLEGFPLAVTFEREDGGIKEIREGLIVNVAGQIRFGASTLDLGIPSLADERKDGEFKDLPSTVNANGVSNELTVLAVSALNYEVRDVSFATAGERPMATLFTDAPFTPILVTFEYLDAEDVATEVLRWQGETDFGYRESVILIRPTISGGATVWGPYLGTDVAKVRVKIYDPVGTGDPKDEMVVNVVTPSSTNASSLTLAEDAGGEKIITSGVMGHDPPLPDPPPDPEPDKTLLPQALPDVNLRVNMPTFVFGGALNVDFAFEFDNPSMVDERGVTRAFGFTAGGTRITYAPGHGGSLDAEVTYAGGDSGGMITRTYPISLGFTPGFAPWNTRVRLSVVGSVLRDNGTAYSGSATINSSTIKLSNLQVDVPPDTPEIFTLLGADGRLVLSAVFDSRVLELPVAFLEGTYAPRMLTLRDVDDLWRTHGGIPPGAGVHSFSNYGEGVFLEIRTRKSVPVPEGETVPTVTGIEVAALELDPAGSGEYVEIFERDDEGQPLLDPEGNPVRAAGTTLRDLKFRQVREHIYRSDPLIVVERLFTPANAIKRPQGSFVVQTQSAVPADGTSPALVIAKVFDPEGNPVEGARVEFSTEDADLEFEDPANPGMRSATPPPVLSGSAGEAVLEAFCDVRGTKILKARLLAFPGQPDLENPPEQEASIIFVHGPRLLVGRFRGKVRVQVPETQQPPTEEGEPEPPPPQDLFENPDAPMTLSMKHTGTHGVRVSFAHAPPADPESDPDFDPDEFIEAPAVIRGVSKRLVASGGKEVFDIVAPARMRYTFSDIRFYGIDFDGDGLIEPLEIHAPHMLIDDGLLESSAELSLEPGLRRMKVVPLAFDTFPPSTSEINPVETDASGSRYIVRDTDRDILEWKIDVERFRKATSSTDLANLIKAAPTFLPGPNRSRVHWRNYYGAIAPVHRTFYVTMFADDIPSMGTQFDYGDRPASIGDLTIIHGRYELFFAEGTTLTQIRDFLDRHGLIPVAFDLASLRVSVTLADRSLSTDELVALQQELNDQALVADSYYLPAEMELFRTDITADTVPTKDERVALPSIQEAPRGTTPFGGGAGTVNLHNGELVLVQEDLRVPGVGMDWHHTRTYRSQVAYDGPQGHGWDFNYNIRLGERWPDDQVLSPSHPGKIEANASRHGNLVLFDGTGRRDVYVYDPLFGEKDGKKPGGWFAPPGRYDRVYKKPSSTETPTPEETEVLTFRKGASEGEELADYALVDRHRTIYRFRCLPSSKKSPEIDLNGGRNGLSNHMSFQSYALLLEIQDRNTNTMRFSYNGAETGGQERNPSRFNRLTKVVDTTDREIAYRYNEDGTLKEIEAYVGGSGIGARKLVFGYYDGTTEAGGQRDLKYARSPLVQGTSTGNDFPSGKFTSFTYATTGPGAILHNLLTVTDADGNGASPDTTGNRAMLRMEYGTELLSIDFDRVKEQTYGRSDGGSPFTDTHGTFTFDYALGGQDGDQAVTTEFDRKNQKEEWTFFGETVNRDRTSHASALRATPTRHEKFAPGVSSEIVTRYTHDAGTELTKITYPLGSSTEFKFEEDDREAGALKYPGPGLSRGNLLKETRKAGTRGGGADLVTEFTYHEKFNFVESVVRPRGAASDDKAAYTTNFVLDPDNGNVLMIREPALALGVAIKGRGTVGSAAVTVLTYTTGERKGLLETRRNPAGFEATPSTDRFAYDVRGYLRQTTLDEGGAGLVTVTVPDAVGNVTSSTDPRGITTRFEVNALNQVVRVDRAFASTDPEAPAIPGQSTRTFYDFNDNVTRVEQDNDTHAVMSSLGGNARYDSGFSSAIGSGGAFFLSVFQYDGLNNVVEAQQSAAVTRYRYDRNENRTEVQPPVGAAISTDFNTLDLPRSVSRFGMSSGMTYDAHGNRKTFTDGNGRTTVFEYDGFDRVKRIDDPLNRTDIAYDAHGNARRTAVTGYNGRFGDSLLLESFTFYDNLDRPYAGAQSVLDDKAEVDGAHKAQLGGAADDVKFDLGRVVVNARALDLLGRAVAISNDRGNAVLQDYDKVGRLRSVTDAAGNVATFTPDANGNVLEIDQEEDGQHFITVQTFDALNRLASTRDAGQHVRTFRYDSRGNMVSTVDALSNRTNVYFDRHGRQSRVDVLSHTTETSSVGVTVFPNQVVRTESHYDDNGNLVLQVDPLASRTRHAYDAGDRKTSTTYADGHPLQSSETFSAFDGNGVPRGFTDRRGVAFSIDYDAFGKPTSISASVPAGLVIEGTRFRTMRWDGLGRPTFAQDDNGGRAQTAELFYDGLGRVIADAQTRTTSAGSRMSTVYTSFDGAGNRRETVYPSGKRAIRGYTDDEQLETLNVLGSSQSAVAFYEYAGPGRLKSRTLGNGLTQSCEYDHERQLRRMTYSRETTLIDILTTGRDAEHHVTAQEIVNNLVPERGSTPNYLESLAYDPAGRLKSSQRTPRPRTSGGGGGDGAQETLFQYDAAGNATGTWTTSFQTTKKQERQRTTTSSGREVNALHQYTRLFHQQFVAVVGKTSDQMVELEERPLTYDGLGNLTAKQDLEIRYDAFGRPVRALATRRAGQVELKDVEYWVKETAPGIEMTLTDPRGDMTPGDWNGGTIRFFGIDGFGNPFSLSCQIFGNTHRDIRFSLLDAGARRPYLDNAYWSPRYEMTTLNGVKLPVAHYTYDGLGRRATKEVEHRGNANGEHQYFWEGQSLLADEIVSRGHLISGTPRTRVGVNEYVWGASSGEAIRLETTLAGATQGDLKYLAMSPEGGVFTTTGPSGGNLRQEVYETSPGGVGTMRDATTGAVLEINGFQNAFVWQGQYLDVETGLFQVGPRYYSPELGRFIQTDPMGAFFDGRAHGNPYTYGGNNPAMFRDDGHAGMLATAAIGAVAGFIVGGLTTQTWEGAWIGAAAGGLAGLTLGASLAAVGGAASATTLEIVAANALAGGVGGAVQGGLSTGSWEGARSGFYGGLIGGALGAALPGGSGLASRILGSTLLGGGLSAGEAALTGGDIGAAFMTGARAGALGAAVGIGVGMASQGLRFSGVGALGSKVSFAAQRQLTDRMVRSGKPSVIKYAMSEATTPPMQGSRQSAIDRAWKLEVELITKTGRGTAAWTRDEIRAIMRGASYRDLGFTGHHINKVADYPAWQGDPRNIAFLKQGAGESHMTIGHPGGTRMSQPPGFLIDRQAMLNLLR